MDIFELERCGDDAAIIWMDDSEAPVNTLKDEMIGEFDALLSMIEQEKDLRLVLFASKKSDNFIAGADLDMLPGVTRPEQGTALSQTAQALLDRIENLLPVTVAAINGSCLGGGLEFALAFDGRVASTHSATRLGLPEVRLGLLPGSGGTQRLPALIGARAALDLILTGRSLTAQRAYRAGIVDEIVPKALLMKAAITRARKILSSGKTRRWRKIRFDAISDWLLSRNPLGRKILFDQAKRRTFKKTRGNYPATDKILDVIRTGLEQGRERGFAAEAAAFGELVVSPESRQLVNLFHAGNQLKHDSGVDDPEIEAGVIEKIGVLGAGLMGAGIAYVTVDRARIPVRLKDQNDDGIAHGLAYIDKRLSDRLDRRSISRLQHEHTLARVSGTADYSGFDNCSVVIEAVYESVELKHKMVRDVEDVCGSRSIFASNTSAIPISEIASAGRFPERIVGMHYFSPVEKMPLLEIVRTELTAPWVVATCVELGKKQGKTVIVVDDGPGFYTTRILGAYMSEAARLLIEGVAVERIDEALLDFGFPVGPMALLDEVGIDVAHKVSLTLHGAFGDRMKPVEGMQTLVDDQRMGKKNNRGLYLHGQENRSDAKIADESVYRLLGVTPENVMTPKEIAERCALQMVNEAAHCLGDGILRSARDGDIGAVMGLGFPAFLGGPFRYLDSRGCSSVLARLEQLEASHGERFSPAPLIMQNKKFYN